MPVPHRSTEPTRPRHRREVHPTHWLISTQRQARELAEVKVRDDLRGGRQARPACYVRLPIKRRVVPGAERRDDAAAYDAWCAAHAELVAQRVDRSQFAERVGPGLAARDPYIMIARDKTHVSEGALAQL